MRRVLVALAFVVAAVSAAPANAAGFLQDLFEGSSRPSPVVYYRYAPADPHIRTVLDQGFRVSRRPTVAKKSLKAKQAAYKRRLARKNAAAAQWQKKMGAAAIHKSGTDAKSRTALKVAMPSNVASTRAAATASTSGPNPALCCRNGEDPSKLIHADKTLRIGDAYMTPQGLRIYRGRIAAERAAFVDFRKAEIAKEMKARYAALEERRILALYAAAKAKSEAETPAQSAASKASPVKTVALDYAAATPRTARDAPSRLIQPAVHRTALDPQGRVIRVVGP